MSWFIGRLQSEVFTESGFEADQPLVHLTWARFGQVGADVQLYTRYYGDPLPCRGVSSGHWHEPTGKWLVGERSKRITRIGFEIGGT